MVLLQQTAFEICQQKPTVAVQQLNITSNQPPNQSRQFEVSDQRKQQCCHKTANSEPNHKDPQQNAAVKTTTQLKRNRF